MSANCLLALCLQLGVGVSHANPQDCGIWYMCGPQYPHTLHLDSVSESIGIETEHWRVGYENLGRFTSTAKAIASENPALIPCAPKCYPISNWYGSGKVAGGYVEYIVRRGAWHFEAGPWLYRATWQENLTEFPLDAVCGGGSPLVRSTHCNVSADKTTIGAMGGIGYGPVAVTIRNASDRGPDRSLLKNFVTNVSIRWNW